MMKLRDLYRINKGTGKLEPKPAKVEQNLPLGRIYCKGIRRMLEGKITQADLPQWIAARKLRHGVTQ
jgi:hypothetical protein